jgi:hypothetical protein
MEHVDALSTLQLAQMTNPRLQSASTGQKRTPPLPSPAAEHALGVPQSGVDGEIPQEQGNQFDI